MTAAGPMVSLVLFDADIDGDKELEGQTTTSATGEFGLDILGIRPEQKNSRKVPPSATFQMIAFSGIETATGLQYGGLYAPAGATVISPLSNLINAQGSQHVIRELLGLDSGPNAIRADTNLLTFNAPRNWNNGDPAIARDAGRVTAVNLQLAAFGKYMEEAKNSIGFADMNRIATYTAQFSATGSSLDLTDAASIQAYWAFGAVQNSGIPREWAATKANLIARYMAAMPQRIASDEDLRAWAYTFAFYVYPELEILGRQWPNPAAARIAAIQTDDIRAIAEWFKTSPVPVVGLITPMSDYRELTSTSDLPYSLTMTGCGSQALYAAESLPTCNDVSLFYGIEPTTLISATAVQPEHLTVNLVNGGLQLSRVGSFTGFTSVKYTARGSSGENVTGVMFVRVRPPE